jgi:hypothetical protein
MKYQVTSLDTGKTFIMTLKECHAAFGKNEFKEILQGYLPNLIVVKIKG